MKIIVELSSKEIADLIKLSQPEVSDAKVIVHSVQEALSEFLKSFPH